MNKDDLALIIEGIVNATSGSSEPDYTILATGLILIFAVFALLTKYMATQIMSHQDEIRKEEKKAFTTVKDKVSQHGIELVRHDERLGTAEKNITKLWDEKQAKQA